MVSAITRRGALVAASLLVFTGACAKTPSADGNSDQTTLATSSPASASAGTTATTASRGGTAKTSAHGHNSAPSGAAVEASAGQPGAYAGVLLGPGAAASIVVDVLVQAGESPSSEALASFTQNLADASGKPVSVVGPSAMTSSARVHTAAEARTVANAQGNVSQTKNRAVIHLLYFAGSFTDDHVLGVTVSGDTIAVFPDHIQDATTPLVGRARLERAVVTHELGHVMGLVDLYLNDNRDDADHPGHSTNPNSVMYWAVETDLVGQLLDGPPPTDFDASDRADLAEIHSGAAKQV